MTEFLFDVIFSLNSFGGLKPFLEGSLLQLLLKLQMGLASVLTQQNLLQLCIPPGSGVPVPGKTEGSKTSKSMVM